MIEIENEELFEHLKSSIGDALMVEMGAPMFCTIRGNKYTTYAMIGENIDLTKDEILDLFIKMAKKEIDSRDGDLVSVRTIEYIYGEGKHDLFLRICRESSSHPHAYIKTSDGYEKIGEDQE